MKFVRNNSSEERELQIKSERITGLNNSGHYPTLPHIVQLQKQLPLISSYSALGPMLCLEISNQTCFLFLSSLYPLKRWHHKTENYKNLPTRFMVSIMLWSAAETQRRVAHRPVQLCTTQLRGAPCTPKSLGMVSPGMVQCTTWAAIRGSSEVVFHTRYLI